MTPFDLDRTPQRPRLNVAYIPPRVTDPQPVAELIQQTWRFADPLELLAMLRAEGFYLTDSASLSLTLRRLDPLTRGVVELTVRIDRATQTARVTANDPETMRLLTTLAEQAVQR